MAVSLPRTLIWVNVGAVDLSVRLTQAGMLCWDRQCRVSRPVFREARFGQCLGNPQRVALTKVRGVARRLPRKVFAGNASALARRPATSKSAPHAYLTSN